MFTVFAKVNATAAINTKIDIVIREFCDRGETKMEKIQIRRNRQYNLSYCDNLPRGYHLLRYINTEHSTKSGGYAERIFYRTNRYGLEIH